uniref:Uncharacterized protein n=1 Tax=Bos indicus x Bos taurus TaxID=30522 RepID=A0A4W2C5K3_BOBOX
FADGNSNPMYVCVCVRALFLPLMEGEIPAIGLRNNKQKKLKTSHQSLLRFPSLSLPNLEVVGSLPT